jgi:hypothetical protein
MVNEEKDEGGQGLLPGANFFYCVWGGRSRGGQSFEFKAEAVNRGGR